MVSILFHRGEAAAGDLRTDPPACFRDLNLDQVVAALTAGRKEYGLEPYFHTLLRDPADVEYRHEVFRDLEKPDLFDVVARFAAQMRRVRQHVAFAGKLHYRHERQRWLLEGIDAYCRAVSTLAAEISGADIESRGLAAFRGCLRAYAEGAAFSALQAEAAQLKERLAQVRYCLLIQGLAVKVTRHASEQDYVSEVERTFAKFRQAPQKSYLADIRTWSNLNHVEAMALECVARLFPDLFKQLEEFCSRNGEFADGTVVAFDREVQFYLSYLELLAPLRRAGLERCYPRLCDTACDTHNTGGYDLALGAKRIAEGGRVVCNGFRLDGEERVLVVTGPNQGGKTTFARAFGQLHYLAALGLPVPGSEARLVLADNVLTHFGKREDPTELRGKLEDDLLRIAAILAQATERSVIIMNEIFTSTTVQDALFLSRRILEQLSARGSPGVLVTFLDELAAGGPQIVSMVAAVDPQDHTVRTFEVRREPANGLAYALSLAARHRLNYESIKERVRT